MPRVHRGPTWENSLPDARVAQELPFMGTKEPVPQNAPSVCDRQHVKCPGSRTLTQVCIWPRILHWLACKFFFPLIGVII